jgi:hypothetical protein
MMHREATYAGLADAMHTDRVNPMPVEIAEVTYYSASEVSRAAGVSRQSLWRWRQLGKVPLGRKDRRRQILFTAREVEQVKEYADRLEPAEPTSAQQQLRLFRSGHGGSK